MNKRLMGLLVGSSLTIGIAIGDFAEPAIQTFTDHVVVILNQATPLQEAIVTVPSDTTLKTTPRGWKQEYTGLNSTEPSVTFENLPARGVVVTVHLDKESPAFLGYESADISAVKVVYGNEVVSEHPVRGVTPHPPSEPPVHRP